MVAAPNSSGAARKGRSSRRSSPAGFEGGALRRDPHPPHLWPFESVQPTCRRALGQARELGGRSPFSLLVRSAMAKLKKKPRRGAVQVRREAGTAPSDRHSGDAVRRDRRLALSGAALASKLSSLGIHRHDVLLALEACVGGVFFGDGYFRLELGLRFAFAPEFIGGLPRTADGRALLRFGVEGDMEYFVTEDGSVWTQDGIADRLPHCWAPDPIAFAREFRWPNLLELEPLAPVLACGE